DGCFRVIAPISSGAGDDRQVVMNSLATLTTPSHRLITKAASTKPETGIEPVTSCLQDVDASSVQAPKTPMDTGITAARRLDDRGLHPSGSEAFRPLSALVPDKRGCPPSAGVGRRGWLDFIRSA